jgi:DNA-binding NtrC family response regulator
MEKNVVVIDDDRGILMSLQMLLESDYSVKAFMDAREALEHIQKNPTDLVVVDLLMPNMTGIEFVKELQSRNLKMPVLVMSASTLIDKQLKDLNVAGFIKKPFDIDSLEAAIKKNVSPSFS